MNIHDIQTFSFWKEWVTVILDADQGIITILLVRKNIKFTTFVRER